MTESDKKQLNNYRMSYYPTRAFIPNYAELPNHHVSASDYIPVSDYGNDLNAWLRNHYHPIVIIRGTSRTGKVVGYIRVFTGMEKSWPNQFSEPKINMEELYPLVQLFTYDIVRELDFQRVIDKHCAKKESGKYYTERGQLAEMISIDIDQLLLRKFKSIPNMADRLYRYVCDKM